MLLLLLLGDNGALADPGLSATIQPITFGVGSPSSPVGTVFNLGDQRYTVNGGQVVLASIDGTTLDPGANLNFSLRAEVKGLTAAGSGTFDLQGTTDGQTISVHGRFAINSSMTMALAQVLPGPSGDCTGEAAKTCSELPTFFVGAGVVQTKTAGAHERPLMTTTMMLESPYFDPWGAPIVLASADGSILIVTTYSVGTIQWNGIQVGGPITGTTGPSTSPTPTTGSVSLNSSELEDLVTGQAVDKGTIAFGEMTPSYLNTQGAPGTYAGTSFIPTSGAIDCSPILTMVPGTCLETGFDSTGQFVVQGSPAPGQRIVIAGNYQTTWTVPALAFSSTSVGTVATLSGK